MDSSVWLTKENHSWIPVSDDNSSWSPRSTVPDIMEETERKIAVKKVLIVAISMLLLLLVCGGNVLVMLAIKNARDVNKITKMFVVNLAVADFLIGMTPVHRIVFELRPFWVDSYWSCVVKMFLVLQVHFTSAATLMGK